MWSGGQEGRVPGLAGHSVRSQWLKRERETSEDRGEQLLWEVGLGRKNIQGQQQVFFQNGTQVGTCQMLTGKSQWRRKRPPRAKPLSKDFPAGNSCAKAETW